MTFSYDDGFEGVDFRAHPERYRIGRGEQGVSLVESYKGELLPLWRCRTAEVACLSAAAISARFHEYLTETIGACRNDEYDCRYGESRGMLRGGACWD